MVSYHTQTHTQVHIFLYRHSWAVTTLGLELHNHLPTSPGPQGRATRSQNHTQNIGGVLCQEAGRARGDQDTILHEGGGGYRE